MKCINKLFELLNNNKFQKKLKILNRVIGIASIFYIYKFYDLNFNQIKSPLIFNPISFLIIFFIYLLTGNIWVNFLISKKNIYKRKYFLDWSYSNLGKYIPGSIGLVSIRLENNNKTDSKKILFGLLEEQFIAPLILLPAVIFSTYFYESAYFFYILFATVLLCFFIFRYFYFQNNYFKKNSIISSGKLFFLNLLLNVVLIYYIFYDFAFNDFISAATFYIIATNLGLFFVGIPAGLGIREAIFILLLENSVFQSQYFEVMVHIRLLFFTFDLLFGILGFISKIINNK